MTVLTSQTTFTVQNPATEYVETVDLVLLPENAGSNAARELRYPGDLLPPLIYLEPPDSWENFDTGPLTARPVLKSDQTLEDTLLTRWPGYGKDQAVKEVWKGSETVARMPAYFFRRLWEYFTNPPAEGFITWNPKDRLDHPYNIEIENLTVGGQNVVSFDNIGLRNGYVMGEVTFSFRICGEAS